MDDTLRGRVFEVVQPPAAPDVALLRVLGDVDLATVPALERQLSSVMDAAPATRAVILDFDLDAFVCVRGLRLLLEVSRRLRLRGGRLVAASPPAGLQRMVQILQLDTEIEIVGSVHDALRGVAH